MTLSMTNKDIKVFIQAIRDSNVQKVSELINTNKEYVNICSVSPPKKDDGQSGLQVAFKTGNFDIAKLLIEQGADVNFLEKSDINDWTAQFFMTVLEQQFSIRIHCKRTLAYLIMRYRS
jgi:hypothetical protein